MSPPPLSHARVKLDVCLLNGDKCVTLVECQLSAIPATPDEPYALVFSLAPPHSPWHGSGKRLTLAPLGGAIMPPPVVFPE